LLKFSADSGARAVRTILADPGFERDRSARSEGVRDLVIVGAGVSGMAAGLEAGKAGIDFLIYEASQRFSTIVNFPRGKPIYTYPKEMIPAGDLALTAEVKEALLEELEGQTRDLPVVDARVEAVHRRGGLLEVGISGGEPIRALRVILAIGRSGNFRRLGVAGEDLDKVYNRLHDPQEFCDRQVLVVGGGDSGLETAIALAQCGTDVTLSYRGAEFSRPKPDNLERLERLAADPGADVAVERAVSGRVTTAAGPFLEKGRKPGRIRLKMATAVEEIRPDTVVLKNPDGFVEAIPNDVVFSMIGREPPLDFLRRSGIRITGEWTAGRILGFVLFLLFCTALYNWKSGGVLDELARRAAAFPYSLAGWAAALPPKSLLGITLRSATGPSFWYTLAYSLLVVAFGFRRMRRRATQYVRWQTLTLMAIQVVPLFLLPEILLPWLEGRGWLPAPIMDALFPRVDYGHGREFWRAYGLILAWPLNVYNVFTDAPIWGWLAISFAQTGLLIPLLIYFYGKGAYCGWICSCGALAETLGDGHRHKMPHGPGWNRLNMAGQVILAVAVLLLLVRTGAWLLPEWEGLKRFATLAVSGSRLSYKWVVDVFLAGIVGYGVYFWYSGRFWCRFFCPLAALMHIFARFSRFRILADKKKCISCNVCTSVCHQGIDVMNFANKGLLMADPECVRCSACVLSCPTGVLTFGQVDRAGHVIRTDSLQASPVQLREG
jgi:thioredoxin reductase/NAD-dependent dihydropyrimidine dehydrogenase PreA subunit